MAKDKIITEAPQIKTGGKVNVTMRMSVNEYREYSAKKGKIMGRKVDQVIFPTEEELRVYINTGYNRAMLKERYGMNDEQLDVALRKMSYKEGLDRVVKVH